MPITRDLGDPDRGGAGLPRRAGGGQGQAGAVPAERVRHGPRPRGVPAQVGAPGHEQHGARAGPAAPAGGYPVRHEQGVAAAGGGDEPPSIVQYDGAHEVTLDVVHAVGKLLDGLTTAVELS